MLKRFVPYPAKVAAKRAIFLGRNRHCPVCRSDVRLFQAAGDPSRADARCPVCGSLERTRLIWLFFSERTNLLDGRPKRMLHIAPELTIEHKLREQPGIDYLTADLMNPQAMVQMDITDIHYPDGSFDVIHNSHVLEHVPDDRRAMTELHRVLKPDGWMTVQIPINVEQTIEDPSITDPAERKRLFGQEDHVRRYGPDAVDRLREAGFNVETFGALDIIDAEQAKRLSVPPDQSIFYCRRSA